MDRLALLTTALWSLASERLGITEEELQARVQQIDLSDGKLDGRVAVPTSQCPKCSRQISRRHRTCLYCGTALPVTFPG